MGTEYKLKYHVYLVLKLLNPKVNLDKELDYLLTFDDPIFKEDLGISLLAPSVSTLNKCLSLLDALFLMDKSNKKLFALKGTLLYLFAVNLEIHGNARKRYIIKYNKDALTNFNQALHIDSNYDYAIVYRKLCTEAIIRENNFSSTTIFTGLCSPFSAN